MEVKTKGEKDTIVNGLESDDEGDGIQGKKKKKPDKVPNRKNIGDDI